MGFMDKAKEAAQKASASAQTAAAQGQAKFNQFQQNQSGGTAHDHLFAALGRAFYAEQRQGGSTDSVVAALQAVDASLAPHPTAAPGTTPPMTGAPADGAAGVPPTPAVPASPPPPTGNFTLDDL